MLKFSIKRNVLSGELNSLQAVVERKSTIAILSNILIESLDDGKIRMTGTDIDVTIAADFDADVTAPGTMCVAARKLTDIVKQLPSASEIHFSQEPNYWVKITCEKSNFKIAGSARENFPDTPKIPDAGIEVPANLLANFINHTSFAITNEQSRFTLSGAKFIISGDSLRMVTTDGHRLALVAKETGTGRSSDEMDTLIPKKALTEIAKIIKTHGAENVLISQDFHHIFCVAGSRRVIARKLSGNFPNYEMVIPKENDKSVRFCANELKSAVARVSLMADERTGSIKMNVSTNAITIRAKSSEEGEGSETINAEYHGEETDLGFNNRYLMDFLSLSGDEGEMIEETSDGDSKKTKCRFASMSFKDTNSQTMFSYENFSALKCVIMPLRL
jgi:DNA polymerase-3 subunit beta